MDKKYTVKFTATIEVEVETPNGPAGSVKVAARQLDSVGHGLHDIDWEFEEVREGWDSDV